MLEKRLFELWQLLLELLKIIILEKILSMKNIYLLLKRKKLMICTFSAKISFISGNKQKEGIETMKQKNAWLFLIIGSSVLLGLYLLFKFSMKNI